MINSYVIRIKQWLQREWKFVLVLFMVCVFYGYSCYEYDKARTVPMKTISQPSANEIVRATSKLNIPITPAETRYITQEIVKREQLPPEIVYVTKTQKEADVEVDKIAKQDKADFLLKNTTNDYGTITNKYYGVHMEKKHEIKLGITNIDHEIYASAGYQNKNMDIILHSKNFKRIDGASVMMTVARF